MTQARVPCRTDECGLVCGFCSRRRCSGCARSWSRESCPGLGWGVSCARGTGGATRGGRCARPRRARRCRAWRRRWGCLCRRRSRDRRGVVAVRRCGWGRATSAWAGTTARAGRTSGRLSPTTGFCCCAGCGCRTWPRTCWAGRRGVWRRIGKRATGCGRCWPRRAWRRRGPRRATRRRAGRAWAGPRGGRRGRRRRRSRRACGYGAWKRAGKRRCGGRRRALRGRFRPLRWTTRPVGRGASSSARTWPTGACGSGWSGWGRPGNGIRASRCRRSSPAAPSNRRPTASCTITRWVARTFCNRTGRRWWSAAGWSRRCFWCRTRRR